MREVIKNNLLKIKYNLKKRLIHFFIRFKFIFNL
jgi:hypothetical protein